MINKVASIGFEGRDKLVAGADYIANAVKKTIGPGGQNFAIEKGNRVTNDGITIARELLGSQEDEIEEQGAKILLNAVTRANDEVGDGSSTATVLTQAIVKEAVRQLPSKDRLVGKMTPSQLLRKIDEEYHDVVNKLKETAVPIETEQQLIDVATVSVENTELGTLIGKTQWELGPEGVILAEETNDKTCSIERLTGIMVDNGFGSAMVINNPEKEALEVKNVAVIFTNHTVSDLTVVAPVIEQLIKLGNKEIVFMARAFTNEAIQQCLKNMEAGLNIYPLNAPYTDQAEIMQDLAAILGGRFINIDVDSLDSLQVSDVGFATHVLAKRSTTIFTGKEDEKSKTRIDKRLEVLEKKKEGTGSEFERKSLATRMAQLKYGFALLKIGAVSETERKYLKDKADDAVNAVRAAFQEGIVKGGGLALYEIADTLPEDSILANALKAPHIEIKANYGEEFTVPDSVVDSVKVLRVALEKACSVAGVLATAGGAVVTRKKKDKCCHEK